MKGFERGDTDMISYTEENSAEIFRSYLRKLLRALENIRNEFENNNSEIVKDMLDLLIDDTKKDIDSN